MNQHELAAAFKDNRRVYGTMVASPSPKWAAEIKKTGIDFVFIDTEHIPLDRTQVAWMCQAYRAQNIAPIVRIPSPSPYEACVALDGGAVGIVAPYLETVEQAKVLRGAVKYRPLKGKRLMDVLDGREKLSAEEENWFKKYNDGNLLILNIESVEAIANLDDLLSVPDVDAVFIGPHDLSINLGVPENYEDPKWNAEVLKIIKKCREYNIGIGNHFSFDIEKQIMWAKNGMNIVIWNADVIRLVQAFSSDFKYIKEKLGDTVTAQKGEISI